jgi:tetratricopeptide (TPR) repeat protein
VYLAFDPDVSRNVAIKVLLIEHAGDTTLLKRFQQEILTIGSLRHENIVTTYAGGEDSGHPYLVMEFLDGQTLREAIECQTPLTLLDKVRIMTQVAEGFAYAHSRSVVHRDVKPANIMILPDGSVKIMDFGIALTPGRQTHLTWTGGIIGTPSYFAPEILSGKQANEQTDIFSFGEVYYELLTGRHPFHACLDDWAQLQRVILEEDPPLVTQIEPNCPEALETLVHRTMAKQPEFRYRRFEEVAIDSAAILADLRNQRAEAILQGVPQLVADGDLEAALVIVTEAQQLNPANLHARQFRAAINRKVEQVQIGFRIADFMKEAAQHAAARRFAQAMHCLEFAVRLDPNNPSVQERLEWTRAKLRASVRATQLISQALALQQKELLHEALQALGEALQMDSENADARLLSDRVGAQLGRRRSEQRLRERMQAASEQLAGGLFADALRTLDELQSEQPDAAAPQELRALVEQAYAEHLRRAETVQISVQDPRSATPGESSPEVSRSARSCSAEASDERSEDASAPEDGRFEPPMCAEEIDNAEGRTIEPQSREAPDNAGGLPATFTEDPRAQDSNQPAAEGYATSEFSQTGAAVSERSGQQPAQLDLSGSGVAAGPARAATRKAPANFEPSRLDSIGSGMATRKNAWIPVAAGALTFLFFLSGYFCQRIYLILSEWKGITALLIVLSIAPLSLLAMLLAMVRSAPRKRGLVIGIVGGLAAFAMTSASDGLLAGVSILSLPLLALTPLAGFFVWLVLLTRRFVTRLQTGGSLAGRNRSRGSRFRAMNASLYEGCVAAFGKVVRRLQESELSGRRAFPGILPRSPGGTSFKGYIVSKSGVQRTVPVLLCIATVGLGWLIFDARRTAHRERLIAAADGVILGYRLGRPEGDWERARIDLMEALRLSGSEDVSGRLSICQGHLAIRDKRIDEAASKFEAAQRFLPLSPDPGLGLALVYVARNELKHAELTLEQARTMGYSMLYRDKLTLAKGYSRRADATFGYAKISGALSSEHELLSEARQDYQRAISFFDSVGAIDADATAAQHSLSAVISRLNEIAKVIDNPKARAGTQQGKKGRIERKGNK